MRCRTLIPHGPVCRNHGSHFEKAKAAFEEGAGNDEVRDDSANVAGPSHGRAEDIESIRSVAIDEKKADM